MFQKLPQCKNNFLEDEITTDNHALVEWTQPFQNIILRNYIPIENIELMPMIKLRVGDQKDCILNFLAQIVSAGQINYENHAIIARAKQINNN